MKEFYEASLAIWEFSKYPRNIGVRKNYINKAKKHLQDYRAKKKTIEDLWDSRQFKKSKSKEIIDLKKAGDLMEDLVRDQTRF